MAHVFTLPQLGSTMEEGVLVRWLKAEGDAVEAGEPLVEMETDKATMEVESPASGVLLRILEKAGALVPIRQPIAVIGSAGESVEMEISKPEKELLSQGAAGSTEALTRKESAGALGRREAGFAVSPRAMRLIEQLAIPVRQLAGIGTGPGGRVLERDVKAFVSAPAADSTAEKSNRTTPLAARMASDLQIDIASLAAGLPGSRVRSEDVLRASRQLPAAEVEQTYTVTRFAGMRKRIAENISRSAFTAPHVTLTLEADMTECSILRGKLQQEMERRHFTRLTYNDLLVRAVVLALEEHPRMNATLEGEEIRLHQHKNIGIAVALDEGLVVPVLREAEKKSLGAVSAELKKLIENTRAGKFTPDDLTGGTFTITNLGSFEIEQFNPILVPGQAGILGVGAIQEKPAVYGGVICIRQLMPLCLSFDHRMLDGAPAARFLQRVKALLQSPYSLLV